MVFHRDVVIDEGIYLYAGKLVAAGKIPYIDFVHSQGPFFPVIYGIFNLVFGQDIYTNRIITAILSLLGLIFLGKVAKNIGGSKTELVYYLFCVTSIYSLTHYVVVTTYGITIFFLYFAFFLAICKNKPILSYVVLLVASAVRLSAISVIPILVFYLVYR
ncbi:MAG: hypothetical protein Q7K21_08870, partial [Elusimicrobiota bacterium]|nr:hypothetical protein [Elusimicrobiota bacterium]